MAFDEHFAARIRAAFGAREIVEKKMFGGIGFMINGHLACGIHRDHLMVHVDVEATDALLKRSGAIPFEMGGRQMRGWILVAPDATKTATTLAKWVELGAQHAESLPAKPAKPKKPAVRKAIK